MANIRFFAYPVAILILSGIFLRPCSAAAAEMTIPYEVKLGGVGDRDLLKGLEDISDAISLKDNPPSTIALLRRRAERDREQFIQYLRSVGFYSGRVEVEIDSEAKPVQVAFQIDTGPPYLLKSFDLIIQGDTALKAEELPGAERLGFSLNEPFKAAALLDAEKSMRENLGARGFPFAKIPDRKVVVDHAAKTVSVSVRIETGPEATFGPVVVTGLEATNESIVLRKIPWKEGDRYHAEHLALLHKELIDLGLFSAVTVSPAETLREDGTLPVTIAVKERKYRSVGAGVSYRSDEKLGVKFSWENRNLMGEGERLGLVATFSDLTYAAEGNFRRPFFFRDDQALTISSRLAEDKPDAYTSRNLANSAMVTRDITRTLKVGGGVGFKQARITQLGEREEFSLVSLPFQLAWDGSDRLLDPSRGGRMGLHVAPFADLFKEDLRFTKGRLSYAHYLPILDSPSIIMAGRVNVGVISGEERLEIPADERFYAGGGGSVRGYAYQTLAPLREGVPTGGKSLFETSLEARLRVSEQIGLAFFLDGGNAFADILPFRDEGLFWGTGIGVRYFTPIGPLRFDIAVPLERRDGVDDSFQIYISIGQSF